MIKNFPGTFPKTHTWYRLTLRREKASCSQGSPYSLYLKKGASNKLIVFFGGGGVSWGEYSASRPITLLKFLSGKEAFYFPKADWLQEVLVGGILAEKDLHNPFHDWNFILLPYATGDFHVGNNDFAYTDSKGRRKILHHSGACNVTASLEAAQDLFPLPEQLLIMGESAGAIGCIAQAAQVAACFPSCDNITVFSDSGQLAYSKWRETARDIWKADRELWECIQTDCLNLDWFRLLYQKLGERAMYLNACSYHDAVLSKFQKMMNHGIYKLDMAGIQEFYAQFVETQKALLQDIPGFHCYISAWNENKKNGSTAHTASRFKLFHTPNADGISLAHWLDDAVNQGKFYNIGLELLDGS